MKTSGGEWRTLILVVLVLSQGGCLAFNTHFNSYYGDGRETLNPAPSQPEQPPSGVVLQTSAPATEARIQGPLTLDALLRMALDNHPDVTAAAAKADAARGKWIQAGLYPNPQIGWEADELGHNENAAGEQGPFVSQELVTAGKLELAKAAAAQGVAAADWQAVTKEFDLITRVRLAYVELLTATREVAETKKMEDLAKEGLEIAKLASKAGTGARIDELPAQVELDQSRIRLGVAKQRQATARKLLAAAVGVLSLPDDSINGGLELDVPAYEWTAARETMLSRSSELLEARAMIQQAEAETQRACAEAIPNVHLKVRPFYSYPDDDTRLMVEAGMALPIFNKNQGNIFAAQADLTRAVAEARQVELRLTERLASAFQRYEAARAQKETYEKRLLPNAQESMRLIRDVVKEGDPQKKYDYFSYITAQRTLVQAQLSYLQVLNELWRSASEIAGLLQEEIVAAPGESLSPPKADDTH